MNIGIKIFVGVVVFLGVVSGIFLLTAKKKPTTTQVKNAPVAQTQKPAVQTPKTPAVQTPVPAKTEKPVASQESIQARKALVRSQWNDCKAKTIPTETKLLWSVQITEGIPVGGTYAKGNLDGDTAFPVRVIIKSDSEIAEKIKLMLIVGKTAFLRGTCTDSATDGSVILQAF